jgi:hypothetical protein
MNGISRGGVPVERGEDAWKSATEAIVIEDAGHLDEELGLHPHIITFLRSNV